MTPEEKLRFMTFVTGCAIISVGATTAYAAYLARENAEWREIVEDVIVELRWLDITKNY